MYHAIEYLNIVEKVRERTDGNLILKKRRINKKLTVLINRQRTQHVTHNIRPSHQFYPRIQNNTNIIFSESETALLNKGLKHNITPIQNITEEKKQLLNIENAIVRTQLQHRDNIRQTIVQYLNSNPPRQPLRDQINEEKTVKSIVNKLTENSAILTKADKGNTTVIMSSVEYNQKIDDYIQKNNIVELPNDPTEKFKSIVNNSINANNIIENISKYHLKMIKPTAPQLRGLPKIHKDGTPIRPLINYTTAPAYKLSKYMNKYLNNRLNMTNSTSIKNHIELINKLKHIHITNNSKLASFDITNMYGNIPVNETLDITQQLLADKKLGKNEIKQAINILRVITSQNYFQHNTKFFQQIDGLPMGNPLSGTLAEIFINHLEQNQILNDINTSFNQIVYWYRYVDDILILFNGTSRQLKMLHNYINNIHSKIQFTLEIEENKQINFLDLSITHKHNQHSFNIYRKPTQTDHTIHSTSNHPQQHKRAAYHHMITRLNTVPLNTNNYTKEINTIKHIANANGFKVQMIDEMNVKFKRKTRLRSLTTLHTEKDDKRKYITIEYDKSNMNTINRIFNTYEYKLAYKTSNKLEQRIKTRNTTIERHSGVYKIKCDDCGAFYIGQTGRCFNKRYNEHINEVGKTNIKSNFALHLTQQQHNCTSFDNNLTILHRCPKGEKLDRKEEIEIYKHRFNPLLLNDRMPHNGIYEMYINTP